MKVIQQVINFTVLNQSIQLSDPVLVFYGQFSEKYKCQQLFVAMKARVVEIQEQSKS